MKTISVTIVIPAYNEEFHLKACLDSIAAQHTKPDTVIVVDNNSHDNTAQVAASYPFVTVVHEQRQGIVHARNAGFNAVKSQLIARIDADTVLPPSWVDEIKRHYTLRGQRAALFAATGPSYFRNRLGQVLWYPLHRLLFFWASRLFARHHTISGSNMYMTRAAWECVADEVCLRTDIHEDMDLAIHLYHAGVPIIFSRAFPNTMLGRNIAQKVRYYLLMWWRILFIRHYFSAKCDHGDAA